MVRHFLTTAAAITSSAVTDAEFEKLDSEFQRLLRSRRIPADMRRKLAACRGCGRDDSEFYMLPGACG
jgi:hypothetical protein